MTCVTGECGGLLGCDIDIEWGVIFCYPPPDTFDSFNFTGVEAGRITIVIKGLGFPFVDALPVIPVSIGDCMPIKIQEHHASCTWFAVQGESRRHSSLCSRCAFGSGWSRFGLPDRKKTINKIDVPRFISTQEWQVNIGKVNGLEFIQCCYTGGIVWQGFDLGTNGADW